MKAVLVHNPLMHARTRRHCPSHLLLCLFNCISGLIFLQILCLLGMLALATAQSAPICRAGQSTLDSDNDGICDALEVLLGTNPKKADSDGDGISYAFVPLYLFPLTLLRRARVPTQCPPAFHRHP